MRITGTRFHLVETRRETGAICEHLLVPGGPGLGVEVDEERLGQIAYEGTRRRQLREGR